MLLALRASMALTAFALSENSVNTGTPPGAAKIK